MAWGKKTEKNEQLKKVNKQIVQQLENGVMPWTQPWSPAMYQVSNPKTPTVYKGINRLVGLMNIRLNGYESPYYLSMSQMQGIKGASLRTGSKSMVVIHPVYKTFEKEVIKNGVKTIEKIEYFAGTKGFPVFNTSQMEGLPEAYQLPEVERSTLMGRAEKLAASFHVGTSFDGKCQYDTVTDRIQMPPISSFESKDAYYSTLFGLMIQATGHESRLNRKLKGKYGTGEFAFEQLMSEIGAAYLCSYCGLDGYAQHGSFIQMWIAACEEDENLFYKATTQAQKAMEYLLERVGLGQEFKKEEKKEEVTV